VLQKIQWQGHQRPGTEGRKNVAHRDGQIFQAASRIDIEAERDSDVDNAAIHEPEYFRHRLEVVNGGTGMDFQQSEQNGRTEDRHPGLGRPGRRGFGGYRVGVALNQPQQPERKQHIKCHGVPRAAQKAETLKKILIDQEETQDIQEEERIEPFRIESAKNR